MDEKTLSPTHHLGSVYGKSNAEYLRDLPNNWGYDTQIETYKVFFNAENPNFLK